jgi:hypothetical protein
MGLNEARLEVIGSCVGIENACLDEIGSCDACFRGER